MKPSFLLLSSPLLCCWICISFIGRTCVADRSPVQDMCPTADSSQQKLTPFFINGLPCKNPASVTAADFKTSKLNHAGDTDNFLQSSMSVVTAADFPGLNTLGISFARTDLAVDGMVLPHSHPRASELMYVSRGVVVAGFIDTGNQLFQKKLVEGDAFIFPGGLLHFCLNAGYELATMFSVLNSQNPGVVSISGAMFGPDDSGDDDMNMMMKRRLSSRLRNLSSSMEEVDRSIGNVTLVGMWGRG
ncbi:Germin [Macleaya cordata]|uniref:Germin-like protein n=1 Tax=Macleaya cordata TaxID=56857 RepID=A0A200R3M9_MACCD|nr:Germin [Macleaya cordata]